MLDFETLRSLPTHQLTEALLVLDSVDLAHLLARIGHDGVADLLVEIPPHDAARLILKLTRVQAADVLEEMPPDDAADVVEELPLEQAEPILVEMEPDKADELKLLLAYPPESAGSLMTPDYVAVRPDLTAVEALAVLRRAAADAETVHYVYVIDPDTKQLAGVLSLYRLTFSRPETLVRNLMTPHVIKIRADAPQQEAASLLQRHNLVSIPVVDAADALVGIVTIDDVLDALQEEFSEDYLRLAGADADAMARRSPFQAARLRFPWLLGTMGIELLSGLVIARFDDVLRQVILLASFMPIISAVSGNVGLQAAAIIVRGLDTGTVAVGAWRAVLRKEIETTLLMALAAGTVLGTIGAIWSHHAPFGIVIGGAMTVAMLTAAFMGTAFPLVSKRLGFDPATTAGPFETALQDVVGFAVFLWLASQVLHFLK